MENIQYKINNKKKKAPFLNFLPKISKKGLILPIWRKKTEVSIDAFFYEENLVVIEHLPTADELNFTDMSIRTITAYNSEPGQTDDSPCITANGFNVCEHGIEDTVAANFLKFGTKVRIPELFGDKIFVVRDRMNPRFPERIDIWMLDKSDAKNFGVKRVKVEAVLE